MPTYLGTYYEIWEYASNPYKVERDVAELTGLDIKALREDVIWRLRAEIFCDRWSMRHYIKKVLNNALEEKGCMVRVI